MFVSLCFPLNPRHFLCSRFATRAKNALLFYNGRYNERHDFIALEILNGHLQFSFSLGTSISRVVATVTGGGGVNDGQWHTVNVNYLNRVSSRNQAFFLCKGNLECHGQRWHTVNVSYHRTERETSPK